jgi:nucleotidyltransferase substrate binding protein (TIGR01987 family)
MEELKARYIQMQAAYKRLAYTVDTFKKLAKNHLDNIDKRSEVAICEENELYVHRDSLIKRFEFTYEITWKFFKFLLRHQYGIDVASPRNIFQACYNNKILSAEESTLLESLIDLRNQTSHVYDEVVADAVSAAILEAYPAMIAIIEQHDPEKTAAQS